eukprot:2156487-Prorocentrum_lima.AAC.1
MEINLVFNEACGPDLAKMIAAELSFNTLVIGATCVNSPRLSNRSIPWCTPATIPTSSASHELKAVKL